MVMEETEKDEEMRRKAREVRKKMEFAIKDGVWFKDICEGHGRVHRHSDLRNQQFCSHHISRLCRPLAQMMNKKSAVSQCYTERERGGLIYIHTTRYKGKRNSKNEYLLSYK